MNRVHKKLIRHLRTNARKPLTEISREIETPTTTLHDHLRKYEESQLVRKHTTLFEYPKLGFSARAYIALNVDKADVNDIGQLLQHH